MPRSKKSTIQKNPLEQIYATDKVLTSGLRKGSEKNNPTKLIPSIENTGPKTVNRESKNLTKIHKTNKDIRPQDISENISPQENKQDLLAYATIKKWSRLASACSIPPIPLLATAVASGLQIKMIQELCNIYHVPFHKELVKASISSIVGSGTTLFSLSYVAKELLRGIPYAGSALLVLSQPPAIYKLTNSLGTIFMRHFQNQGDLTDLDLIKSRNLLRKKQNN